MKYKIKYKQRVHDGDEIMSHQRRMKKSKPRHEYKRLHLYEIGGEVFAI
jgi:hypothetical protein